MLAVETNVAISVTRSPEAVTGVLLFSAVLASLFIVKNFLCEGFLDSPEDGWRSLIVGVSPVAVLSGLYLVLPAFGLQHLWLFLSLSVFWIGVHSLTVILRFWTEKDLSIEEEDLKFKLNLVAYFLSLIVGFALIDTAMHYQIVNLLEPLAKWLGVSYGS